MTLNALRYILPYVIQSFADEDTRELFETSRNRRWNNIRAVAFRKLYQIEASTKLMTYGFLREIVSKVCPATERDSTASASTTSSAYVLPGKRRELTMSKLSTTTERKKVSIPRPTGGWNIRCVTPHPGEILQDDFLAPNEISQHALAMKTRVPATRIGEIVRGRRAVTPDTALRLARFFGNSPEFWLNLQQLHDLSKAKMESAATIEREVEVFAPAEALTSASR